LLDEFYFPPSSPNTYTWWDCKAYKPRVFRPLNILEPS